MDQRKKEKSESTIFIIDDLSAINQRRLFPSLYSLSKLLTYMKTSNKIKGQGFLKIPFSFTISVKVSCHILSESPNEKQAGAELKCSA